MCDHREIISLVQANSKPQDHIAPCGNPGAGPPSPLLGGGHGNQCSQIFYCVYLTNAGNTDFFFLNGEPPVFAVSVSSFLLIVHMLFKSLCTPHKTYPSVLCLYPSFCLVL